MSRQLVTIISVGLLALALVACGASATAIPTGTPKPAETPRPGSPTALPTVTPQPKPTDTPKPTPAPPQIAKVGERVVAGGIAVTVAKVSKTDTIGQFLKAKTGNTYLVVEVLVESVDKDEAPYNPLYFKVKDADAYEYTSAMLAPEPTLKTGTLAKGDKTRGNVAFEVPTSAKGFVLTYEPLVILGNYIPIKIILGQ